jgi:hypothetical protein
MEGEKVIAESSAFRGKSRDAWAEAQGHCSATFLLLMPFKPELARTYPIAFLECV